MSSNHPLNDEEIVKLLTDLKASEWVEYPLEMHQKRRQEFVAQIAALGLAGGGGARVQSPRTEMNALSTAESWVVAAIVTTVVVYAGVAMYTFRDRILGAFSTATPTPTPIVEQIPPIQVPATPFPATASPSLAPTLTFWFTTLTETQASPESTRESILSPTSTPVPTRTKPGQGLGLTNTPHPSNTPRPSKTPVKP